MNTKVFYLKKLALKNDEESFSNLIKKRIENSSIIIDKS